MCVPAVTASPLPPDRALPCVQLPAVFHCPALTNPIPNLPVSERSGLVQALREAKRGLVLVGGSGQGQDAEQSWNCTAGDPTGMFVPAGTRALHSASHRGSHHTNSISRSSCALCAMRERLCSALRCQGIHKYCSNPLTEDPASISHVFTYGSSTKYPQILDQSSFTNTKSKHLEKWG